MSFQAYLDTIKEKTGLEPADFRALAEQKGLLGGKAGPIVEWLAQEYGLGRGHAMAIVSTFEKRATPTDRVAAIFSGPREHWRATYDDLLTRLNALGEVSTAPTDTYVSLIHGTAKFAIIAATADRLDVGIKLKDAPVSDRFEAAGSWNSMVTHRVRVTEAGQVDDELIEWLGRAYTAAG
jgi:hypothetical protein